MFRIQKLGFPFFPLIKSSLKSQIQKKASVPLSIPLSRSLHQTKSTSTLPSKPGQPPSSDPGTRTRKKRRAFLGLSLGLIGATAATLILLNEEQRKKWIAQVQHLYQVLSSSPSSPDIMEIPGLPQGEEIGFVHGITTIFAGNYGFVTLKNGVKPPELVSGILEGMDKVNHHIEQKSSSPKNKKPLLILNETAYASITAPDLLKDKEGKPQFILSLTAENIESFIEQNRFPEEGDFAALRDSCIRVTVDGFVSNLREVRDYKLILAVNTADAAPIFAIDPVSGTFGLLSCSWHNVAKGEVDELLDKMKALGADPKNIIMGIGPGLGAKSFEFNASDARVFYEPGVLDKRDGRAFNGRASLKEYLGPHPQNPQKILVNMPGMLAKIARESGVPAEKIYCDESWDSMTNTLFFSARRDTPIDKRPAASSKLYPEISRGITFVHPLSQEKKPLEEKREKPSKKAF